MGIEQCREKDGGKRCIYDMFHAGDHKFVDTLKLPQIALLERLVDILENIHENGIKVITAR